MTTESTPAAIELAMRLRDGGAKMYGAFWCSHCFEQKEIFGKEAMSALPYVECYPKGIGAGQTLEKVQSLLLMSCILQRHDTLQSKPSYPDLMF